MTFVSVFKLQILECHNFSHHFTPTIFASSLGFWRLLNQCAPQINQNINKLKTSSAAGDTIWKTSSGSGASDTKWKTSSGADDAKWKTSSGAGDTKWKTSSGASGASRVPSSPRFLDILVNLRGLEWPQKKMKICFRISTKPVITYPKFIFLIGSL